MFTRRRIGGAVFRLEELLKAIAKGNYDGIGFKMNDPLHQNGVHLEVYGVSTTNDGLMLSTSAITVDIKSCYINDNDISGDLSRCDFEHIRGDAKIRRWRTFCGLFS